MAIQELVAESHLLPMRDGKFLGFIDPQDFEDDPDEQVA